MTAGNIMQRTFDALDAIGRFATPREVWARLGGCDYESVLQALRYLHDEHAVLDRRMSFTHQGRHVEYTVRPGAVRPNDGRGYRSSIIPFAMT